MGDFEDVVGATRLELREDQIQMVCKQETREESKVLTAMALMAKLILDQRQENRKPNQDAGSIPEVADLKVGETNKIRDLFMAISEIPGKPSGIELGRSVKLKMDGGLWKIFKK